MMSFNLIVNRTAYNSECQRNDIAYKNKFSCFPQGDHRNFGTYHCRLLSRIPPCLVSDSVSPSFFSSARALSHLRHIAQKPYPIGTPENAEVRKIKLQRAALAG